MKIPILEAIAQEVREKTGVKLEYWSPDDNDRNPQKSHIFGVGQADTATDVITEIGGGLIYVVADSMKCGHSHHEVKVKGTKLAIGNCLFVDLADPESISKIVEFYEPA